MMAQSSMSASSSSSTRGGRVVGDYIFGRQIGSGSFSVVWHARHRRTGDEFAVKEIALERLSRKLQESLQHEIEILKRIRHPNIIAFHDIIQTPGRWFIVLEYCKGGDLSVFIQHHGRVPEATAKYFMQQLASGLQVLRENNVVHRDLKPQNLLLSRNDANSLLKIADFGFARSLQPRVLAETLCGSPLYMAPEIMHLQKYDAKADLWSVGTILFQLVTGKTPFTGNNQIQLLQNIMKSSELRFPLDSNDLSSDCIDLCRKLLRRNPVERLTFEEFFNHPFLPQNHPKEPMSLDSCNTIDASLSDECSPARPSDANSLDDGLPFILDDLDGKSATPEKKMSMRSTYGFSVDTKVDKILASKPTAYANTNPSTDIDIPSKSSSNPESTSYRVEYHRPSLGSQKELKSSKGQRLPNVSKEELIIGDSLEFIDQEYVLVSGPPLDVSSSSIVASRPHASPFESENSATLSPKSCSLSAPMPIIGVATAKTCGIGSLESRNSQSGTSQGSIDMGDAIEQPSSHCMTRIRSLRQCASAVTELVNEKVQMGRQLEAFSVQLVILAIWKQALHICHAQAASAIEGSPSQDARLTMNKRESQDSHESLSSTDSQQPDVVCSQIEKAFLTEVGNAEELSKDLGPVDETTEMPDAMEIIFQSALGLGRNGAVEELMDNMESAATLYSKAVQLLYFLLVEASSLILNPPFSLTTTDRFRLRSYIDILNNRQSQYRSQRLALLKSDVKQSL